MSKKPLRRRRTVRLGWVKLARSGYVNLALADYVVSATHPEAPDPTLTVVFSGGEVRRLRDGDARSLADALDRLAAPAGPEDAPPAGA